MSWLFFGERVRSGMYRCFDNNKVNLDSWETSEQILLGNEEPAAKEDTTIVGS